MSMISALGRKNEYANKTSYQVDAAPAIEQIILANMNVKL